MDSSRSGTVPPATVETVLTGKGFNPTEYKIPIMLTPNKFLDFEINEESIYKRLILHRKQKPDEDKDTYKPDTRYKIKKVIGEGAAGKVFLVKDFNFDREVAMKVPKQKDMQEKEIDDFIREAHVSASLEHPNIVPVYDLNVDNNGNIYLSMRKIKGHSLKNYTDSVRSGTGTFKEMPVADMILIFLKVCDAICYAHSKGQIHQDIKPENIMLGDFGEVFLIDWGSSSYSEDEVALTPAYMSPEQAEGHVDERTDIYCLAATMFHVLTLRLPTQAESVNELWRKKRQGEITLATEAEKKRIPQPLLAIIMKALRAEPEERYQTVEAFAQDLKNYQAGLAVTAYRETFSGFFKRWYLHNKSSFWTGLSSVILVLLLVISIVNIWISLIAMTLITGIVIYIQHTRLRQSTSYIYSVVHRLKGTDGQPLVLPFRSKTTYPPRPGNPELLPETDSGHWWDMEYGMLLVKKDDQPTSPQSGASGKTIYLIQAGNHPYFTAYVRGFSMMIKAFSMNSVILNCDWDKEIQSEHVEKAIRRKPDMIILNPLDGSDSLEIFKKIHQHGIPCIISNLVPPNEALKYCLAWTGPDNWGQGRMLAKELATAMGKKGGYAIVAHMQNTSNYFSRSYSVITELSRSAPEMKLLELESSMLNSDKTEALVLSWLDKHGTQLKGLVIPDDSLVPAAVAAVKKAGRYDINIVSYGNSSYGMSTLAGGAIDVITYQSAEADGALPVYVAAEWFYGRTVQPVCYLPKHIISRYDVNDFMPAQW
jgi:ribose transport system substrate-binding protein